MSIPTDGIEPDFVIILGEKKYFIFETESHSQLELNNSKQQIA